VDAAQPGRERGALGVGDDPLHLSELGLARRVAVGPEQHRDRTDTADRDHQREGARARAHHHADMFSAPNADRDQAPDDVVDPLVDLARVVRPVLEQEEGVVGRLLAPLLHQRADRDPRARLDLTEPGQPWQLTRRLERQLAQAAKGALGRSQHRARDSGSDAARELEPVADAVAHLGDELGALRIGDGRDGLGQLTVAGAPVRPGRDRGPCDRVGVRADDEPEMPGAKRQLVHVRAGGGLADCPHAGWRRDLVDGADDAEDRAGDVGQRHEPVLDHEAAFEHPVVGDELAQELGHRRTGPGDPAVRLEEPALPLARQQRLAVVQPQDEVDPAADRLDRVEQPEAGAAGPRRQRHSPEHPVGEELRRPGRELLGDPERHRQPGVDGAAEGDQRPEPLVAPVGRGLVAEHPALRITAEVDVQAGGRVHAVDGVGHGQHVIGQRALESPLLLLGRPEVDDPRIDAVLAQQCDRARARRHVVHLRREHHRGHEQHRGRAGRAVGVVVAQPVDALFARDLVRGRLLVGGEPAEARHLERILRRRAQPYGRSRQLLGDQVHVRSITSSRKSPGIVRVRGG
jgi:hypothetical protein